LISKSGEERLPKLITINRGKDGEVENELEYLILR
jgi:hypothetical protein